MTQDNETPEEHSSVVGGSTAARRIGCPRSYTLEQRVPPDPGNAYTREGTALHEMIARVLDKDVKPEDLLPFTYERAARGAEEAWSFTVDEDLWYDLGQPALDAFDQFIEEIERETGGSFSYMIEARCAMPGIAAAFGTSDIVWTCGDMSGIWDWKFGRGEVTAEDNKQLLFYALAAASTYPAMFGGAETLAQIDPQREVVLSIMQPKLSAEPSEYIVTVEELHAFHRTLLSAVKTAQSQGDKAPIQKGSWCAFATCRAICPFWAGQSAAFGEKMAALKAGIPSGEIADAPDVIDGFDQLLPELLDLAEAAEEWSRMLFATAHQMAEDGAEIDGWKLKAKRSPGREWAVDEDAIRYFMKNRRYKLDEYMPRKLLTMPQCEKLLARDDKTIPEEMVQQRPSSGTTLVRADNPATAVELSPQRAKRLGDKLAALSGGVTEA